MRMVLQIKKHNNGFFPVGDDSAEVWKKLKDGEEIFCEYKPRRNYKFHKKLFSMLNLVKDNQNYYKSVDNILTECKFRAGYYEIHVSYDGLQTFIPKSINFASMDNDEFERFYSSAIDTCLALVPMGRKELEDAILRYC